MNKHILSILAFVVVSFAAQGMSHFVINQAHFASIDFTRSDPILAMGVGVMLFEGIILTLALHAYKPLASVKHGLYVSLSFGLFLASYIAVVEPSKYQVPSIANWVMVEASASLVQFVVFGLLLGYIHAKFSTQSKIKATK